MEKIHIGPNATINMTPNRQKKLALAEKLITHCRDHRKQQVNLTTNYHGIPFNFFFGNSADREVFDRFIPKHWNFSHHNDPVTKVYCYMNSLFGFSPMEWEDMYDPQCHIHFYQGAEVAIQRDFIGIRHSDNSISLVLEKGINDSFFNALRWLLPRQLLLRENTILHSSCVINRHGLANFFLGPSGAGKTTIASMAGEREVLGDDMNLLTVKDGVVYGQTAALGGQITNYPKLDQLYRVGAFYWLKQSDKNRYLRLRKSHAAMLLTSSFANLFWRETGRQLAPTVLDLAGRIVNQIPFFELEFTLNGDIWDVIEQCQYIEKSRQNSMANN